nr:UDP-N-acetylmuramate dehydrogenase [Candidatus Levybacteria bacterium]
MLKQNVSLKDYSNYKIGGNAAYFLEVFSRKDLIDGLKEWYEVSLDFPKNKTQIFVLGGGTNVLFSDDGFYGLVIKNSIKGIEVKNNIVIVGAGESISSFLDFCIKHSLSGFEWAGGLPGTVGGAIRGNAGAFNGEIKDTLVEVESLNLKTLKTIKRSNKNCELLYRNSVFKNNAKDEIIISAVFNLSSGNRKDIENKIRERVEHRNLKHPLEYPNIGSIFKNVPIEKFLDIQMKSLSQYIKNDPFSVIPAAKLIFLAGLKGERVGDVMVSPKHTNFIVNMGNGKASEVKRLIGFIKERVKEEFNVELEEEIMYVNGGDLNG